jgi:hypothetical protein
VLIELVFLAPILLCCVFWFLGRVCGVGYILRVHVSGYVSAYGELHIGHVTVGNRSMPKNSCFLALPMYCPVRNFSMLVFCESVIVRVDQNLLDISLSMSGFVVHLLMLGNCFAIIFILVSRSCLVMYVWRHLTRPLSGCLFDPGQISF